jgi:hypothetical protein
LGASVYLRTDIHEEIIRRGHDPADYVNRVVKEALDKDKVGVTKE